MLPKAKIRNKKAAKRQFTLYESIAPTLGLSGECKTTFITDYPIELQEYWRNLKPPKGKAPVRPPLR